MIEAHVDVKTTDGYLVRLFVMFFTKRRPDQVKTNCYAQSAQIRKIRKKRVEIIAAKAGKEVLGRLLNCGLLHDMMAIPWGKCKDLDDELTHTRVVTIISIIIIIIMMMDDDDHDDDDQRSMSDRDCVDTVTRSA